MYHIKILLQFFQSNCWKALQVQTPVKQFFNIQRVIYLFFQCFINSQNFSLSFSKVSQKILLILVTFMILLRKIFLKFFQKKCHHDSFARFFGNLKRFWLHLTHLYFIGGWKLSNMVVKNLNFAVWLKFPWS